MGKMLDREAVFYLFALPFAVLTLLFGLWPILLSIEVSFTASATAGPTSDLLRNVSPKPYSCFRIPFRRSA